MEVNCSPALLSGRTGERKRERAILFKGKKWLILDVFSVYQKITNPTIFG